MSCDPHEHCITCGDVGVEMRVLRVDDELATCEDGDGEIRTVEIALLDGLDEGDVVLVHADVALVRL
jgi:hypothetical protein